MPYACRGTSRTSKSAPRKENVTIIDAIDGQPLHASGRKELVVVRFGTIGKGTAFRRTRSASARSGSSAAALALVRGERSEFVLPLVPVEQQPACHKQRQNGLENIQ